MVQRAGEGGQAVSPRLARQLRGSIFIVDAEQRLAKAQTEADLRACMDMLDSEAFADLPEQAQADLNLQYGGAFIRVTGAALP